MTIDTGGAVIRPLDTGGGRSPATVYRTVAMRALILAAVLAYLVAWVPFVLMTGCAARQVKVPAVVPGPQAQVVIPRYCMEKVELTDASECRHPVDGAGGHGITHCTALKLTYRPNCETIEAKPK